VAALVGHGGDPHLAATQRGGDSTSLGEDGWELVQVVFGDDNQRGRQQEELYFKRPKE
jgi:hypothetical protein